MSFCRVNFIKLISVLFIFFQVLYGDSVDSNTSNIDNISSVQDSNNANLNAISTTDSITQEQTQNIHEFTFYGLYSNADIVVKNVIWILSLFSILTWCVLICKFYQYYKASKMIKADYDIIKNAISFQNLRENTALSPISTAFINEINDEITKTNALDSKDLITESKGTRNSNLKNRLKIRLESAAQGLLGKMRLGVALLASIGSSAPFIGLFGTVWGIMNSFIGIAKSDNASLAVVAPGIAEALFATAFGLVAAIPAVLFYNYLTRVGVSFSHKIDSIVTSLYLSTDRELE